MSTIHRHRTADGRVRRLVLPSGPTVTANAPIPIEWTATQLRAPSIPIEWIGQSSTRVLLRRQDARGRVRRLFVGATGLTSVSATSPVATEWISAAQGSTSLPVEWLTSTILVSGNSSLPVEWLQSVLGTSPIPIEWLATVIPVIGNSAIPIEWLGSILGNSPVALESLVSGVMELALLPIEWLGSVPNLSAMPLEWLASTLRNSALPIEVTMSIGAALSALALEWASGASSSPPLPLEWLTDLNPSTPLPVEWLEIVAQSLPTLLIEWLTTPPGTIQIPVEWGFTPVPPLQSVSIIPRRILGREPRQFDPIDVGEIDNFAFNFASDMGDATIVSTRWSCQLAPFQTIIDFVAQSRILTVSAQTTIVMRSVLDGTLLLKSGFFSVASVGGFPASSVGATYVLEATANLSDGRVLTYSSTVLVKPFGP